MHADEVDRTVIRAAGGVAKCRSQEILELQRRHLTAAHRKISVLGGPETRDVTGDWDVPRRIGKNQPG